MNGRVLALHAGGAGLAKEPCEHLTIDGGGAVGDRHHGRDPERALLVVSDASYRRLASGGIDLPHGTLGENVVVSGLPAEPLDVGAVVRLGAATAVATGPCTVCRSLAAIDPRLPKAAHGRRGSYLRVLRGGSVTLGDAVGVEPYDAHGPEARRPASARAEP